jgi:hypothetical protein
MSGVRSVTTGLNWPRSILATKLEGLSGVERVGAEGEMEKSKGWGDM